MVQPTDGKRQVGLRVTREDRRRAQAWSRTRSSRGGEVRIGLMRLVTLGAALAATALVGGAGIRPI